MRRVFQLDTFCGTGPDITMTFDASPWGAGGLLTIDNVITAWFATEFQPEEGLLLGVAFGGCAAQQVAEAMAVLIGVRAWLRHWQELRPRLAVKSDSIAALVLLANMKSKSGPMNLVGTELALT
eukprot:2664704-Heterocapsa_arctica.AAC.1